MLLAFEVLLPGMVLTLFRVVFVAVFFLVGICRADPPPNDNFENRILLQGSSINFTGSLAGATWQDYDLAWWPEAMGDVTVWWSWVAPDNTPVMVYCDQMSGLNNNGVVFWYANHEYTDLLSMRPTLPAFALALRTSGGTSYKMFTPEQGKKYEVELAGYSQGTFPLRLVTTNVPIIFQQPISLTAPVGGSVVFFASAGGVLPLSYQWMQNGVVLPGQT